MDGPNDAPWTPRNAVLLAALVALAIALRVVHLVDDPLWFDEASSLGIAAMRWSVILGPMAEAESSPPGYYILAKLWTGAFGWKIVPLRWLSVLAGVAAIPVVWKLAGEAFGVRAAWLAASLVALSATHVRLSQEARGYAVLFLGAALSILAAQRLVAASRAARPTWLAALLLGGGMGAMLWLHPTAAIIGVSLNAFVLAGLLPGWRSARRGLLALLAADLFATVLAGVPLWAAAQHILGTDAFVDRWILAPGVFDVAMLYGRNLVAPFLHPFSPAALAVQGVLLGTAAWAWWRARDPWLAGFAAMLVVGGLLLPAISQFRPVFLDRTAFFLLAPLSVLLAAGWVRLPRQALVATAALLLGLHALGVVGFHRWENRKERWDFAAALLQARMQPGEVVVLTESAFLAFSLAEHLGRVGMTLPPIIVVPSQTRLEQLAADELGANQLRDPTELCTRLHGVAAVWLVMRELPESVAGDPAFTSRAAVRAALEVAQGRMTQRHEVPGITLERWTAPGCGSRPPER